MKTVLEKFNIWQKEPAEPDEDWALWATDLADYASNLEEGKERLRILLRDMYENGEVRYFYGDEIKEALGV